MHGPVTMKDLEERWSRYKYLVLERSPGDYIRIRQLLKDKSACPERAFTELLESALAKAPTPGTFVNTAQHVWGYFKNTATEQEKQRFGELLQGFAKNQTGGDAIKGLLYELSRKYDQQYLLNSHYFDEVISNSAHDPFLQESPSKNANFCKGI